MNPVKACPVVVRDASGETMVLAFRHPAAGCQLVKGSIDKDESPKAAAERELEEEAGVSATAVADLGLWQSEHDDQVWSFHLCRTSIALPETWKHWCEDDGGHWFEFFWQPLNTTSLPEWHPVHARAFAFIKRVLHSRSISR